MADLSCKGFSTIEERQAWLDWKGYKTPKYRLVNVFQSEDFDKELPYRVDFLDTDGSDDGWQGYNFVTKINRAIGLHKLKNDLGKI